MRHLRSRKGFSLVELIVVVAIIAVLGLVISGSLALTSHARARSAAEKLDAMLSQCKIYDLSGADCILSIERTDEGIFGGLYRYNGDMDDASYAELGTALDSCLLSDEKSDISLTVGGAKHSLALGQRIVVRFSGETGAIDYLSFAPEHWDTAKLSISYGGGYSIELIRITGSHELDVR